MTKKPKQKVLSFKDVMKQAEAIDKYSTYIVNKERNEVIKYNAVFSETSIENLLNELFHHIQYDIENKIGYFTNDQKFTTYVNFLIIKYFTNLKEVLTDSLETNILTIEKLRKVRYFSLLFEEVFDSSEVERVFVLVNRVAIQADKLLTLKREDLEKLASDVKTDYYKGKAEKLLESMDAYNGEIKN